MEGGDGGDGKSFVPSVHGSIITKPTPFRPQPGSTESSENNMRHQPLDGMFPSSMFMSAPGDFAFLQQSFGGFDFRMDSPGASMGSFAGMGMASLSGGMDMGSMLACPSAPQEQQPPNNAPQPLANAGVDELSSPLEDEPHMTTRSGLNHAKPPLSARPTGRSNSFADRFAHRNKDLPLSSINTGRQSTARFKATAPPSAITMPGARTTSGSYLTIPAGVSPTTLLDSPVLLPTAQAEPSPTTGTYLLPSHYSGAGSASGATAMVEGAKEARPERGSGSGFVFKPIPKLMPASAAQSLPLSVKAEAEHPAEARVPPVAAPSRAERLEEVMPAAQVDADEQEDSRASAAANHLRDFVGADDGYNWRKYGQKQVKGCAQPRSYYKCTHPDCSVKKKVERSEDGTLVENVVKGVHNHPKPAQSRTSQLLQPPEAREKEPRETGGGWSGFQALNQREGGAELADSPEAMGRAGRFEAGGGVEGERAPAYRRGRYIGGGSSHLTPPSSPSSVGDDMGGPAHTPPLTEEAEDDDLEPDTKRRKGEGGQRSLREPRVVVLTKSSVDILDDGYRWRKYGQKMVKGNPHPRSYYKCTYPDCGVRKHVERASHDVKSVMTTYEGKHNHELPASRSGTGSLAVALIENKTAESGGWAHGSSPEPAPEEAEDHNQVERGGQGYDYGGGGLGMLEDALGGGLGRGEEGLLRRRLRVAGEGSLSALLSSEGVDGSLQISGGGLSSRGLMSQQHGEGGSGYALRSSTMDGTSSSAFGSLGGGGSSSAFRPGPTTKALPR